MALKGIRYDDKNEFFGSLEETIRDMMTSSDVNDEKLQLAELLRGYCDLKNFKLKPGHRNFIMNLMREIDNSDVNEFFKNEKVNSQTVTTIKIPAISPTPVKFEMSSFQQQVEDEQYTYEPNEQIYLEEQQSDEIVENNDSIPDDEEEYLLEEYLTDENRSIEGMEGYVIEIPEKRRRLKSGKRAHRKPERMYNEEFLQTNSNPRKRRVTTSKFYPNTDEGTKERFRDLMAQSMQCILSKEQLASVENVQIDIEKQSECCWSVNCPLCRANIKLAVVYENNGKYVNYKRSNFERHLRYKHCKTPRKQIQLFLPSSPSRVTNSPPKFSSCSLKMANN